MCSRSSSFDSKLIQGERAIIVLKQESCQAISENNSCTAYTTDKKNVQGKPLGKESSIITPVY